MRVLITGAGGQLGHDLREVLVSEELHPFDHAGLDITDRGAVDRTVQRIRPHWVINAAAFNDVDGAEANPEAAFAGNAQGPGNLADAAAQAGAAMLHVSTDYVFDGRKGTAYTEDDPPNPLSVYGRSKYEGERWVLASGTDACVVRTAWLYGHHGKNFVTAIRGAAARGAPIRVVADQIGSPTATMDLARAIGGLIQTPYRGLFHVANAGACSRYDFARAIVRGAVDVIPISGAEAARPAPRPANAALSSVRWPSTGLGSLRSWEAALDDFLATLSG